MTPQNYPLWTAWVEDESTAPSEKGGYNQEARSILRSSSSGRVIGWWTIPGDGPTSLLVPVVAGPGLGMAFPVSDEEVRFFYGDDQDEAIDRALDYQLRETDQSASRR